LPREIVPFGISQGKPREMRREEQISTGAESREQRAESREQRAESREQRAESKERRARSEELRAILHFDNFSILHFDSFAL
jgi:hypothetical protein